MQTLAHFGDGGARPVDPALPADLGAGRSAAASRCCAAPCGADAAAPGRPTVEDNSPITVLGHRFASGEIDEDEYWRRLSVLDEQFGRTRKGGAA